MEHQLILNVIVQQCVAILESLASKDEALPIGRDTVIVQNLQLLLLAMLEGGPRCQQVSSIEIGPTSYCHVKYVDIDKNQDKMYVQGSTEVY